MAITILEQNTVSNGCAIASKILKDIFPLLSELNIIYDSDGGVKQTLTQQKLDSVASFSGLTKAQLDDGMFVLTATLRPAILNAYSQLAEIAARG